MQSDAKLDETSMPRARGGVMSAALTWASWLSIAIGFGAMGALPVGFAGEVAPDPAGGRGATLYEKHCVSCHDSLQHVRRDRRSTSYATVIQKVQFWSDLQRLEWTEQEIDEVATFLNARYYHFEVPEFHE